jgi:hypothetical protein
MGGHLLVQAQAAAPGPSPSRLASRCNHSHKGTPKLLKDKHQMESPMELPSKGQRQREVQPGCSDLQLRTVSSGLPPSPPPLSLATVNTCLYHVTPVHYTAADTPATHQEPQLWVWPPWFPQQSEGRAAGAWLLRHAIVTCRRGCTTSC